MEDGTNASTKTSPCRFTKTLTVLLLAAPLALLLVLASDAAAQSKRKSSRARQRNDARNLRDHIPPMTLTDGSLELETPLFSEEEHNQPGNRPHKYKNNGFNHIYKIRLWNITEETSYISQTPELNGGWRLHIWLEQLRNGTYERVPSTVPGEPQLVIKGTSLEIESDKELKDPRPTNLPDRPSKYDYPSYSDAHFRIAQVWACKGNCTGSNKIVLPLRNDRTLVHIKIFFRHPTQ